VCYLTVPSDIEIYEFGSDYLLGKEEVERGVETVVAYDIRRDG
jgi:hypothetical protein